MNGRPRKRARSNCKDCGIEVLWTTIVGEKPEKRLPVDPAYDEEGTVAVRKGPEAGLWWAYHITADRPLAPGWKPVRNHVAVCPRRDKTRDQAPDDPPPALF